MKKKIGYIVCGFVVLALLVGMLVFVFSGSKDVTLPESINIDGVWEVAAVVENDNPIFIDNEYMVFEENSASAYKDEKPEPYAKSTFKITNDGQLSLPDISRNYKVDKKTDNCIRLYENAEKYMILIRYPNSDLTKVNINKEMIYGKWSVVYKNSFDVEKTDEILEFSEDTLNDYRNGAVEPVSTSVYSWNENNCLFADKWGVSFEFHPLSENTVFFIEKSTGVVWELQRIIK